MERFERALQAAVERLLDEFGDDLLGILFGGSAAYGTPMANSDIDLFVLIRPRWRQRRNEVVEGVEIEMFINPTEQIRRELDDRHHTTVDMFARGRILHDPTGAVSELVERACAVDAAPPVRPGETETYFIRYRPSDLLRDVEDLVEVEPVAAELVLGLALHNAIEAHWLLQGRTPPKPKRALEALRVQAPEAAVEAEQVLARALPLSERVAVLRNLCERILEPVGGILLEGATAPEEVH
jgi:hypothetical protein